MTVHCTVLRSSATSSSGPGLQRCEVFLTVEDASPASPASNKEMSGAAGRGRDPSKLELDLQACRYNMFRYCANMH